MFIEMADPNEDSSSFRSATNRLSPINGLPEINGLELSITLHPYGILPTDSFAGLIEILGIKTWG
jgi:hypothetical protein